MSSLRVVRPGLLTTVQDLGRWGRQSSGVPVAGPMDVFSHRLANRLVGNPDAAAALEVTVVGPELVADDDDFVCAVAGAEFSLRIEGRAAPMHEAFTLRKGERLRFVERSAGARASLAVRGGVNVPATFGSRSTSLSAAMGPFGGRRLAAGDVLPIGHPRGHAPGGPVRPLSLPHGGARLRVIAGPHEAMFTREALDVLFSGRFAVTPQSNRMGYRLDGPRLQHRDGADILSEATPIGSLQVPGSGLPILLMADRQTTGGYARIATVITADLPVAGQLAPGDWIEFTPCTRERAIAALRDREAQLKGTVR